MTPRAIGRVTAGFLLLAAPAMAAEAPAELISGFRLKHGEVRVVRDATLDRIALEQARAMAAISVMRCSARSTGGLHRRARGVPQRILPTATRVSRRRSASGSTLPDTART